MGYHFMRGINTLSSDTELGIDYAITREMAKHKFPNFFEAFIKVAFGMLT